MFFSASSGFLSFPSSAMMLVPELNPVEKDREKWYSDLFLKGKFMNRILITGASGLLGRALVQVFSRQGFFVYAQYLKNPGEDSASCRWVQGDFSTLERIRKFIKNNREFLRECDYLINNYGPLTWTELGELESEEILSDFFHNVIPFFEITRFCLSSSSLKGVINIGFENIGQIKAYKHILPYAMAKNGMLLITESFKRYFPKVFFSVLSPITLKGAKIKAAGKKETSPRAVADRVFEILMQKSGVR
jgi:NAD(P)-dependent dehydrogenase (short-subunit alcohol dehydrogenase family)